MAKEETINKEKTEMTGGKAVKSASAKGSLGIDFKIFNAGNELTTESANLSGRFLGILEGKFVFSHFIILRVLPVVDSRLTLVKEKRSCVDDRSTSQRASPRRGVALV